MANQLASHRQSVDVCRKPVSVLTAVLLLMNVKGMEMVIAKDIDFNHELKVAGSANVLLGIGGGILAFHSMGSSILMHRLGGRSRWVTIISAVTFILLPLIFSFLADVFSDFYSRWAVALFGALLFTGVGVAGAQKDVSYGLLYCAADFG